MQRGKILEKLQKPSSGSERLAQVSAPNAFKTFSEPDESTKWENVAYSQETEVLFSGIKSSHLWVVIGRF